MSATSVVLVSRNDGTTYSCLGCYALFYDIQLVGELGNDGCVVQHGRDLDSFVVDHDELLVVHGLCKVDGSCKNVFLQEISRVRHIVFIFVVWESWSSRRFPFKCNIRGGEYLPSVERG